MTFLHHPAFQSVVLPLLLALGLGLCLRALSPRWLTLAPALALLLSLAVWPGFAWPAVSRVQMLPWLALGGTAVAALLVMLRVPVSTPWLARWGVGVWAVSWLAATGLAAWGALGGSLLLAQFAAMLATVCTVATWQAWRLKSVTWVGLIPLWLFGAALAFSLAALLASAPVGLDAEDPYYTPSWN